MTAIENLAVILAAVIIVKLIVVSISPKKWMDTVGKFFLGNKTRGTILYLILSVVVGYYVLTSMSIVQVAAATLFVTMLIGLSYMSYTDEVMKWANQMTENKSEMLRRSWLSIVIWLVFALWILYAVFV